MEDDQDQLGRLLEFLYACPFGLVEIDRTGSILMINPSAMKHLLPIAPEHARGMSNLFSVLETCAPELRNLLDHFPRKHGTVCENRRVVVDLRQSPRSARTILAYTLVKLGADRAIVTISDITVQVEHERRLKLAEAWFGSMLDGVNDYAVLAISGDGVVEAVNDKFVRQTGHACGDVQGRLLYEVLDFETEPGTHRLSDQLRLAETDGWSLDESWQRRRNGERYWCQRLVVTRVGGAGQATDGFTVVLRDVARTSSDPDDMRRLLTLDHLTGAANRAHFLQRFELARRLSLQNDEPLSLVLVDIDHFKQVNDRFGHPAGDYVLRTLAETCMAALRPGSLFSRLGGEEFAALLPKTTLEEALSIAERLRELVSEKPMSTAEHVFGVTASFGCATLDEHASGIDDLIKAADEQLYRAKRSGRNRVCGPPEAAVAGELHEA